MSHTFSAPLEQQARFITFEGGEGVGKTTQIKLLLKRLHTHKIKAIGTREPGGSQHFGPCLRTLLLSDTIRTYGTFAEALLFSVDRLYHIDEVIVPALASDQWVICDRYVDSTRVYQGIVGHLDPRVLRAIERLAVRSVYPHLTILLDLPPRVGLARAHQRTGNKKDRFESQDLAFHERIQAAFLRNSQHEHERTTVISIEDHPPEIVAEKVWSEVKKRFLTSI
jgi:dTMP kinase